MKIEDAEEDAKAHMVHVKALKEFKEKFKKKMEKQE